MKPLQETHCLNWVEHLLSGNYPHSRLRMYHPATKSYDCLGVAAVSAGYHHDEDGIFFFGDYGSSYKLWPVTLFNEYFGLHRSQSFYFSLNDASKNHLAVAVLVLQGCTNKDTMRWARLNRRIQELSHATV